VLGEETVVDVDAGIKDGDDLSLTVNAAVVQRRRSGRRAGLQRTIRDLVRACSQGDQDDRK
jgi:hypothetical protein